MDGVVKKGWGGKGCVCREGVRMRHMKAIEQDNGNWKGGGDYRLTRSPCNA